MTINDEVGLLLYLDLYSRGNAPSAEHIARTLHQRPHPRDWTNMELTMIRNAMSSIQVNHLSLDVWRVILNDALIIHKEWSERCNSSRLSNYINSKPLTHEKAKNIDSETINGPDSPVAITKRSTVSKTKRKALGAKSNTRSGGRRA